MFEEKLPQQEHAAEEGQEGMGSWLLPEPREQVAAGLLLPGPQTPHLHGHSTEKRQKTPLLPSLLLLSPPAPPIGRV